MDLCKQMTRTRVKGNGSKAASSPATEPNFYSMEPCYEQEAALMDGTMPDVQAHTLYDISSQTSEEREVVRDEISSHPIVEDYDDGMILFVEDQDAEIVLKPIEEVATEAGSWIRSSPQLAPVTVSSSTSTTTVTPALVSPRDQQKHVVTPLRSMTTRKDLFSPPIAIPTLTGDKYGELTIDRLVQSESLTAPSPLHSGDQVYFEGLPFHYLETKDIEESLLERSKYSMFDDHLLVVGV